MSSRGELHSSRSVAFAKPVASRDATCKACDSMSSQKPVSENAPDLRFVIIGAGLSGIMSVIALERAGFRNIALYEKAERFGGTWRDNTYPGVGCDVPSHLY